MKPSFTLGIEEEYQTVDPETRDLRSHIHAEIIEKGRLILQERVKAEMHQSVVEVGTSVCNNISDAKIELKKLRRDMIRLSRENGLRLASAATHPFADWRMQEVTPDERYKNIVEKPFFFPMCLCQKDQLTTHRAGSMADEHNAGK